MSELHRPLAPLISSESGTLEQVVVHTPGAEIESMTPRTAQEVLYNDIIPLGVVRGEHARLKAFLSLICEVYELSDLVAQALGKADVARSLVEAATAGTHAQARQDELLALDAPALAERLICGLASPGSTLEGVLAGRQYDLPPLPNLYFMRDSSVVIGEQVAVGAMAHSVREREAQLLGTVFPQAAVLFDGPALRAASAADLRLEGGDVLVVSPQLVLIGVSERTSAAAVDQLARALVAGGKQPLHVLAVVLPRQRSTIHLDMIFTLVGPDHALAYQPLVSGHHAVDVYRMKLLPGREPVITSTTGLLPALAELGVPLEAVACGGRDPVVREREQWLSAANVFAFGPNQILAYDNNVQTLGEFAAAGFAVEPIDRFLDRTLSVSGFDRLVVTLPGINLARGGGGPRCMTLPVRRAVH